MTESPRSNRPTPRTAAAVEAELRRRIRTELTQARSDAENGQVDDVTLAAIIASAIASALNWHLESPEHTRNATQSSRAWRPASGPRGSRPQDDDQDERERRPRPFGDRARPPFQERGPREFDERDAPPRRGPDERDFQPRRGPQSGRPPFSPRGGRPPNRGGGGGFSRGGGFGRRNPRRGN